MQVQEFMRKLSKLPHMRPSSSKSIRDIIDTVHKHIHGLKRYITTDNKHPYVVFAVIERMDTDTYRAWEKYRPNLARAKGPEADINENANKTGKYIPTWYELEEFLEGEVTIRVHAEKRNKTNQHENKANASSCQNESDTDHSKEDSYIPEYLDCALCDKIHPIYRCDIFRAMSLNDRKNHIEENNLCVRCLRRNHYGPCIRPQNNDECPKC